jgi:hypothetical protein
VREIEPSGHILLVPFLPMDLLSHPLTVSLTFSSILAEHVETSKKTFGNKVQLDLLTLRSPMRVRYTSIGRGS